MEEKLLYKIYVRGRVQGVGFRWSSVREAKSLGITGFVRNEPDGSVFIEAEGTRRQLDLFMKWCRNGPGFGHVDSISCDMYPSVGYKDFRIEY